MSGGETPGVAIQGVPGDGAYPSARRSSRRTASPDAPWSSASRSTRSSRPTIATAAPKCARRRGDCPRMPPSRNASSVLGMCPGPTARASTRPIEWSRRSLRQSSLASAGTSPAESHERSAPSARPFRCACEGSSSRKPLCVMMERWISSITSAAQSIGRRWENPSFATGWGSPVSRKHTSSRFYHPLIRHLPSESGRQGRTQA